MENKFYIDDFEFERYLREKADDFKMYPSKRVWNSIYNNMHPGSRWPSISMCIILIGTLFLVGFLNTNTAVKNNRPVVKDAVNTSALDIASTSPNNEKNVINLLTASKTVVPKNSISEKTGIQKIDELSNSSSSNLVIASTNVLNKLTGNGSVTDYTLLESKNEDGKLKSGVSSSEPVAITPVSPSEKEMLFDNSTNNLTAHNTKDITQTGFLFEKNNYYIRLIQEKNTNMLFAISPLKPAVAPSKGIDKANTSSNKLSEADKFWIENYAMYNGPAPKKWKGKLSWQLYLTPSLIYRTLDNTALYRMGNTNVSDIDNAVIQKPSIGFELGTGLQYDLSKRIKLKTGIQVNYTRYNSIAFDNGHPIATTITMLSGQTGTYQLSRISPYNSSYGITDVKLHNQTFQVSLPIGAAYKIAEVDNISWFAGASIQPTVVLGGKSYLISSDRRNYVEETDMLNKFNLNAGFETYLSIKTGNINWQVGPQFRKQLFSTNSKEYSIEEKLQSYGIKIGIIKKL